jgi:hypothetical protein
LRSLVDDFRAGSRASQHLPRSRQHQLHRLINFSQWLQGSRRLGLSAKIKSNPSFVGVVSRIFYLRSSSSHLTAFALTLAKRFDSTRDTALVHDLQIHIRSLPLHTSSTVAAKQDELDKTGTELWNLSTRLRRNEAQLNRQSKGEKDQKISALCLLRVFAFLLLDSAGGQAKRGRERKTCIRLMKVALKAARACIDSKDMSSATKVLERAADYQEALDSETDGEKSEQEQLGERLRVDYFAVRTTLVSTTPSTPTSTSTRGVCTQSRCMASSLTYVCNRHGSKTAWIQQSICSRRSSRCNARYLRLPPRTSLILCMRSARTC